MMALGIDPGTSTGLALWDANAFRFHWIRSMGIIEAMSLVQEVHKMCADANSPLIVVVEDARKRTFFSKMDQREDEAGSGVREGVGSVKRDCRIWEEFLTLRHIPFDMRTPAGTKYSAPKFARLTGWGEETNQHKRDAAMVVFQLNSPMIRLKIQTHNERTHQQETGNAPISRLPEGARIKTSRRRIR